MDTKKSITNSGKKTGRPRRLYERITKADDARANMAEGWNLVVEAHERKTDYVYKDDRDDTWRDTYKLQLGLEISYSPVKASVAALLLEDDALAGVSLVVEEPLGGLSLIVDKNERALLPGKTITAGYSTGNDDFSVSYYYTFSLEKTQ